MLGDQGNDPFSDTRTSPQLRIEIVLDRLKRDLEGEDQPRRRLALERARSGILFSMNQAGNALLQSGKPAEAKLYFDILLHARPGASEPHVARARCFAVMGKEEDAIEELGEARKAGLSAGDLAALLRTVRELTPLAGEPRLQVLLQP
jgi:tetratricopeptide (TPR) repeat protein